MTATTLKNYSCKDLARMAKLQGVAGWHAMRKEELVQALMKRAKQQQRQNGASAIDLLPELADAAKTAIKNRSPTARIRCSIADRPSPPAKDLSSPNGSRRVARRTRPAGRDGPRPLLAASLLGTVAAEHRPRPIGDGSALALGRAGAAALQDGRRRHVGAWCGNIPIHGGVSHWYVDVQDPPQRIPPGNRLSGRRTGSSTAWRAATR